MCKASIKSLICEDGDMGKRLEHRITKARKEKGWGRLFFPQVEPARPAGWVTLQQYMREYNTDSPKQGRKRFNSIVKTIHFSYLPIIYLWSENKDREVLSRLGPARPTFSSLGSRPLVRRTPPFSEVGEVVYSSARRIRRYLHKLCGTFTVFM